MQSRHYFYFFQTSLTMFIACKKQDLITIDSRDNFIGTYRYTGSVIDTSLRQGIPPSQPNIIYYFGSHNVKSTVKIEKSNLNDSTLYLKRVIQDRWSTSWGSILYESVLFETDPGYAFYQLDWNGKRFSDSFVTAKLNGSMLVIPRQIAPFTGGGINGSPIYIEGTGSFSNNQIILNYSTKNVFGNHWYTITAVK